MKVVTAHAVRSGDWRAIDVPEIPGMSTRAIAPIVGVSHPTVLNDLKSTGQDLPVEQPKAIKVKVAPDVPAGEPSDVTIGWED